MRTRGDDRTQEEPADTLVLDFRPPERGENFCHLSCRSMVPVMAPEPTHTATQSHEDIYIPGACLQGVGSIWHQSSWEAQVLLFKHH